MGRGIDYKKLVAAQNYYEYYGYTHVDVPWTVDQDISCVTKPENAQHFFVRDKVLVASAEQSFLQMSLRGNLAPGKYQGITPCFRDESVEDDLHQLHFMKVELFQSVNVDSDHLEIMIDDAQAFFNQYVKTEVVKTADGFDIQTPKGIELGSYGIREVKDFQWIYGTGLAEPRLTRATR